MKRRRYSSGSRRLHAVFSQTSSPPPVRLHVPCLYEASVGRTVRGKEGGGGEGRDLVTARRWEVLAMGRRSRRVSEAVVDPAVALQRSFRVSPVAVKVAIGSHCSVLHDRGRQAVSVSRA